MNESAISTVPLLHNERQGEEMASNEQKQHQDTIPVRAGEELNRANLGAYLRENMEISDDSPLEINQFGLGASNLTYEIKIGSWEAVLRRPPLGPIAPKAHDMEREFRILRELHPVFPLAPKPFLYCGEEDVIGSPFMLMERRRGITLDTSFPEDCEPTPQLCRQISEEMVNRLVELHSIPYNATGMAELGHPDGFLARQVTGWIGRYERAKTDEIAGVETLQRWLQEQLPASPEATIIHYDYKLNNVMFAADDPTRMVAVFDWEMTTVGDPLADLGCVLSYWLEADDPSILKYATGKPPVTIMPGFFTRQQFIESYANKSGRDVSHIHFYLAFAYYKLAVICQQIYYRWKKGQTQDERFARLGQFTQSLMRAAQDTARL